MNVCLCECVYAWVVEQFSLKVFDKRMLEIRFLDSEGSEESINFTMVYVCVFFFYVFVLVYTFFVWKYLTKWLM